MKRGWKTALTALCLLLCICAAVNRGAGAHPRADKTETLRIAVASDLHYLSQELTDNGPLFQELVRRGDGKLMLDIEAITETFAAQMIDEKPDLLILSGDLSFNGEYQSHADLAEKLDRIEAAGVQVLVIPGNHDINRSATFCFEGEEYRPTENTDAKQFRSIYHAFGYDDALSIDELSGSYVYPAGEKLQILMLDTNSAGSNALPEQSLTWLEAQLERAVADGVQVITVSHQNIFAHNKLFTFGYQIMNADPMSALFRKYGVLVHLSGHMHIQHVVTDGLTEILTSPLSLYPCRYGLLYWDPDSLRYEACSVDVASWAEKQGLTEDKLLRFADYARESFWQNSYRQILESYVGSELSADSVERLARCFADTNLAYFTGDPLDRDRLAEDLAFWVETEGESFRTSYLRSILEDDSPDPRNAVLR